MYTSRLILHQNGCREQSGVARDAVWNCSSIRLKAMTYLTLYVICVCYVQVYMCSLYVDDFGCIQHWIFACVFSIAIWLDQPCCFQYLFRHDYDFI